MPDSESRAEKPAALSAPALEQASRDMAASAIGDVADSTQVETDLASWRKLRDSLSTLVEAPRRTAIEKYAITGYQKSDKSKRKAVASRLTSTDTRAVAEKQLLEANYQIALLTNDADEYATSMKALQRVANDVGSSNAPLAGEYLSKLNAERPNPPEK
jgi:hypothetical protein